MPLIEIKRLGFRYNGRWVLKEIDLEVETGAFFGILGPNGSGKTTLLRLLDGILSPCEGEVLIDGQPPYRMKRRDLARRVALVAQETPCVFPLTVGEVVLMGRTPHLGHMAFESQRDIQVARAAMEATDVLTLAPRDLQSLSGGERQRVLIARALAQEPQILLLDEPTASLDVAHQIRILDLIRGLVQNTHLTVVCVLHDINLAALYCDRLALLHGGRLRGLGPPGEVITESMIREVYRADVSVDRHPLTGLPRVYPLGGPSAEQGNRCKPGAAPQL